MGYIVMWNFLKNAFSALHMKFIFRELLVELKKDELVDNPFLCSSSMLLKIC